MSAQKDQSPPFPDEETEAWRGLDPASVTVLQDLEGGARWLPVVGMCVVAGPRPGRGGRRLLPGGEADSGWKPGWGRLLLLQAEAGRRPRALETPDAAKPKPAPH